MKVKACELYTTTNAIRITLAINVQKLFGEQALLEPAGGLTMALQNIFVLTILLIFYQLKLKFPSCFQPTEQLHFNNLSVENQSMH